MEHQVKYSHQITYEYSFDATGIVVAIVFTDTGSWYKINNFCF